MKITEITYSEGKTLQESSYQPRSFHFSAKAEISEKDDIQECYEKIKEEVQTALKRELLKWQDPKKFIREELDNEDVPF